MCCFFLFLFLGSVDQVFFIFFNLQQRLPSLFPCLVCFFGSQALTSLVNFSNRARTDSFSSRSILWAAVEELIFGLKYSQSTLLIGERLWSHHHIFLECFYKLVDRSRLTWLLHHLLSSSLRFIDGIKTSLEVVYHHMSLSTCKALSTLLGIAGRWYRV